MIVTQHALLIRHGGRLERLLMKLPRCFIRLEHARIGNDYGWTKVSIT